MTTNSSSSITDSKDRITFTHLVFTHKAKEQKSSFVVNGELIGTSENLGVKFSENRWTVNFPSFLLIGKEISNVKAERNNNLIVVGTDENQAMATFAGLGLSSDFSLEAWVRI